MSCSICCLNYNKSVHSEVKCYFPTCSYSACKECTRTYLTGITAEPHCMNCRNKWSFEFTKSALNAIFMENDYKTHRRAILADRAISQIPENYEGALRFGQLTESDLKLKEILNTISGHRLIIDQLYAEYNRVRVEMDNKAPSEVARKFVMQCQNNGCRGMLTQQYKCDLCTKFTCPKCFLAIEGEKADHVCKQDDMDTVEELRKNTKPCPSCGSRISKIDGCFGIDTPILLWNGETKMSQNICVGDVLVGDDETPRTVLDLKTGEDELFEIQQFDGEDYVVNSKHTLVLRYNGENFNDPIEITVDHFNKLDCYKKNFMGYKTNGDTTYIQVVPIGRGTYYGWTVDKNHRFLLNDKTVLHNCDQMWCIECKTAFSWAKGTIEKGVVHNPHYYQWMRQNGGLPRNPNEHQENCGNIFVNSARKISDIVTDCLNTKKYPIKYCDYFINYPELLNSLKDEPDFEKYEEIYNKTNEVIEKTKAIHTEIRDFNKFFSGFHRYINHMEYTELRPLLNNIRTREQDKVSIYKYILKTIEKEELSNDLIRSDYLNMKERAHCDIIEALVMVGKQIVIDCMKEIEAKSLMFPHSSFISNKFDYDRNVSQIKFMKAYAKEQIMFLPQEIESYQNSIHRVFTKYKLAISKYCAYSNIEAINFLITYGSKKTLTMWNYIDGCVDHYQFKNKSEMVSTIKEFKEYLDSHETTVVENTFISREPEV